MSLGPSEQARQQALGQLSARLAAVDPARQPAAAKDLAQLQAGQLPGGRPTAAAVGRLLRTFAEADGVALTGVGPRGSGVRINFAQGPDFDRCTSLMADLGCAFGVPIEVNITGPVAAQDDGPVL